MFRAVNGRCFVDFNQLDLPINASQALELLCGKGFSVVDVDMVAEAMDHVGRATFKLGARMSEAPKMFDCSSFTKWLYGQKGIWIPRLAVQQFEFVPPVSLEELQHGDLIFTSGYCARSWYIGHVSLFSGRSVITAMIQKHESGIVEMSLQELFAQRKLRGMGRVVSAASGVTVIIPTEYKVETSDDIKCLVLSWLS